MENDDKLKAFFKEHAQPLRREVWFSRRVMNRLPGETRRKIRIIEMVYFCNIRTVTLFYVRKIDHRNQ